MVSGDRVMGHGQMVQDAHVVAERGVPGSGGVEKRLVEIQKIAAVHDEKGLRAQSIDFLHEPTQACYGSGVLGDVRVGDVHEDVVVLVTGRGLEREINFRSQRLVPVALHVASRGTGNVDEHCAGIGREGVSALRVCLDNGVTVRDRWTCSSDRLSVDRELSATIAWSTLP